jgi:hypothetical protein
VRTAIASHGTPGIPLYMYAVTNGIEMDIVELRASDSWCDQLLDDQIVDEMPMDLIGAYWR